jgi:hypothetical protein
MREVSLMGYTFNLTIPASGAGTVPINVSGQTLLICPLSDMQIAYEENGFNTNQFIEIPGTIQPKVIVFPPSGKTILWIRLDPEGGLPEANLSVWTDIGSVNL